jgi:toxin ParE1/3/4
MAEINWTEQSVIDLEAIGDYIARDSPKIAQIFVDRILNAVMRLEVFPLSGRMVPEFSQENIREIIFRNYRIVYLIDDKKLYILTIFHASIPLQDFMQN